MGGNKSYILYQEKKLHRQIYKYIKSLQIPEVKPTAPR
jgi:hypothetical protein